MSKCVGYRRELYNLKWNFFFDFSFGIAVEKQAMWLLIMCALCKGVDCGTMAVICDLSQCQNRFNLDTALMCSWRHFFLVNTSPVYSWKDDPKLTTLQRHSSWKFPSKLSRCCFHRLFWRKLLWEQLALRWAIYEFDKTLEMSACLHEVGKVCRCDSITIQLTSAFPGLNNAFTGVDGIMDPTRSDDSIRIHKTFYIENFMSLDEKKEWTKSRCCRNRISESNYKWKEKAGDNDKEKLSIAIFKFDIQNV